MRNREEVPEDSVGAGVRERCQRIPGGSVRPWAPQLRDDVGVEEVHEPYSNAAGGRRRHWRRGGTWISARGAFARRSSLSVGPAELWSRRCSS